MVGAKTSLETLIVNPMVDNNRTTTFPLRSLSPSAAANRIIVSSRHPYISRPGSGGTRSTDGSRSSHSRTMHISSIHMEAALHTLLKAENRAAELISEAREKRNELMRRTKRESQAEIEAFRRQREAQYQIKL